MNFPFSEQRFEEAKPDFSGRASTNDDADSHIVILETFEASEAEASPYCGTSPMTENEPESGPESSPRKKPYWRRKLERTERDAPMNRL